MKFIAIIPARFASTRFPGKPLAMLCGKTIIQRVYEKASSVLQDVYVATDDERIFSTVTGFGGKAIMTSPNHQSGTDRVFEAATKIQQYDNQPTDCFDRNTIIINIQGDEPFIAETQIKSLCQCFDNDATDIATLGKPFTSAGGIDAIENPNSPKIVTDVTGHAMYFSRSPIPYNRNCNREEWINNISDYGTSYLKHIGIYAYRLPVLAEITRLPQSPLELTEKLEQLRWLQNGYRIRVALTDTETIGIDTPADFAKAEAYILSHQEIPETLKPQNLITSK